MSYACSILNNRPPTGTSWVLGVSLALASLPTPATANDLAASSPAEAAPPHVGRAAPPAQGVTASAPEAVPLPSPPSAHSPAQASPPATPMPPYLAYGDAAFRRGDLNLAYASWQHVFDTSAPTDHALRAAVVERVVAFHLQKYEQRHRPQYLAAADRTLLAFSEELQASPSYAQHPLPQAMQTRLSTLQTRVRGLLATHTADDQALAVHRNEHVLFKQELRADSVLKAQYYGGSALISVGAPLIGAGLLIVLVTSGLGEVSRAAPYVGASMMALGAVGLPLGIFFKVRSKRELRRRVDLRIVESPDPRSAIATIAPPLPGLRGLFLPPLRF